MPEERSMTKSASAPLPATDRALPADPAMERAVLSAMLREPIPCVDIALSQFGRNPEVFHSQVHREVFAAILALADHPRKQVDVVAVAHQLQTAGKLEEIGGEVFLAELYGAVATTVNLESWCVTLRELFTLRRMIAVCSEAMLRCFDPAANAPRLLEEVESAVYNIRNAENKSNCAEIRDCIVDQFKYLQDVLDGKIEVGISTGYAQLDAYTGGLKPGEMFVLAARPSIGKTSLALNIIRNMALPTRTPRPRKVAFFSLEMTTEQIARRLLCTEAGLSETVFWNKTFQPGDMSKLTQAISAFRDARIYIDPTGGLTISELRAKARRLRMTPDADGTPSIDVVVIDYLQLMHADNQADGRQNEVAAISSGIKSLAKDLNIPVLVLAQLNREVDKTAGASARPKLSHLRESGAIEQDADIVTFLHRNRDDAKEVSSASQSVEAELILEKNRNGRTDVIKLKFFPTRMEFTAASPYREEDGPPA